MKLNYFNKDSEAVKLACQTSNPANMIPSNNGKLITGYNQKGEVIFYVRHISDVMGWQISYIPSNFTK